MASPLSDQLLPPRLRQNGHPFRVPLQRRGYHAMPPNLADSLKVSPRTKSRQLTEDLAVRRLWQAILQRLYSMPLIVKASGTKPHLLYGALLEAMHLTMETSELHRQSSRNL